MSLDRQLASRAARALRVLIISSTISSTLILGGCVIRAGPKTISPDRFDYSAAIGRSWKEQMVLNMVRLRYVDHLFLWKLPQVVAQYTMEGSAAVNGPDWIGNPAGAAFGASGRWAESPTITYNPLLGERFIKSLLQPLAPAALFSLVQAGWPIDAVMSVGVRSINGIHGGSRAELIRSSGDPKFHQVLEMLRTLQKSDSIGMRVQAEGAEGNILVFRGSGADAEMLATGQAARKILKLSPDATEFSLAFGSTPRNDKEIAVLTRSMLEILQEAAAGVEVPASHLAEGRVVAMPQDATGFGPKLAIPIHSSKNKPATDEVYAAVQYRNHWFWISDREVAAKRGLSFLLILFSLTETGITAAPPTLTISKP